MNRVIKFRAWDKHNRNMHYQKPSYSQNKSLYDFMNNVGGHESGGNRMILMQYTGLKDRSGQEIYEGDIVRLAGMPKYSGFAEAGEKFTIQPESFHPDVCYIHDFKSYSDETHVVVIGNIYENKNLL